jgi:hypothetical protein
MKVENSIETSITMPVDMPEDCLQLCLISSSISFFFRVFSSGVSNIADLLWDSSSLQFNGYLEPLPGKSGRDVNSTTHVHLVPKLRMTGAVPLLPQYPFMAW